MSEDLKKKKVLIIDDDLSFARMIQLLLLRLSFDVLTSFSVADARQKLGLDGNGVDLIILDLMMPEENGFDFLKWRDNASDALKAIPIIVNTAKKVNDEEKKFLLLRCKCIVEKGMDFTNQIVKRVIEFSGDKS